ncbi:MAG: hypothetical protein ACFE0O_11670 [Opitutales bacterium]
MPLSIRPAPWVPVCARFRKSDLLAAAFFLPVAWAFGYALLYSLGAIGLLSEGPTLAHWRETLARAETAGTVLLSLWVAAAVTAIATTIALELSLRFAEPLRQPAVLALGCVPLATPVAVAGFVVYQLLAGGGLLARFGWHLGVIGGPGEFPVLVNDRLAVGIVLAHLLSAVPLLTLFFVGVRQGGRLGEQLALAEALGATPGQARRKIGRPLLLRKGRALVLLVFILTLGSFEIPLILGRESPRLFSVLVQEKAAGFDLADRPQAFVLALLYLLIVLPLTGLYLKWRGARHA